MDYEGIVDLQIAITIKEIVINNIIVIKGIININIASRHPRGRKKTLNTQFFPSPRFQEEQHKVFNNE